MTRITAALGRLASRRPRLMLTAWALAVLAAVGAFAAVGPDYSDELTIPGSDSAAAAELLEGVSAGAGSTVVIASPDGFASVEDAATLDALLDQIADLTGAAAADPLDDPVAATASGRLSQDGSAVAADVDVDTATVDDAAAEALDALAASAAEDGWEVAYAGELGRALDQEHSFRSELIGIVAAVVVLSLALGSVAAMATPIVAGIVAVVTGIAMLGLLSHATSIPEIAPTLATMIGLGVGIDYALFQVVRMRALLSRGVGVEASVVATAATAGTAAAFAGATVAVAICALALSGITFIGWLGYASAIVVVVVVITALTFTPALLALLGPRLAPSRARAERSGRSIAAAARAVVTRPWTGTAAALVVLGLLAAPAASLTLGMTGPGDRPEDTWSRTSYDLRAEHFGAGANATLTVAVALDTPASGPEDPRLTALSAELAGLDAASSTPLVTRADDPTVATARVTPREDANAESTSALVKSLREVQAPDGAELHVGGATATRIDLEDRVAERLPWVVVAVVGASTLLLTIAFRSVLIPLKAALLNLLSVGAAYGVVVAVFQWGWGASLLGLDGPVAIDAFVPMILFTVLFGLSTDYEVFLVTAMREEWDRTHDSRRAIVEGMRSSGQVVTTAAIIMMSVFLSFVLDADPTIKVFGVGLASSILIDATIIRLLLVPALMSLLGRRAWWMPAWLARILPSPHGAAGDAGSPERTAVRPTAAAGTPS